MLKAAIKPLFCLIVMVMALKASAETLPVKTINGRQYYSYTVQPQETVYSLCRKLGITRDMLFATNPSLSQGLKAYQEILIPVASSDITTEPATIFHTVQKGETAYGISKQYGMTLDQFYTLNPQAKDSLRQGDTVKVTIPESAAQPVADASVPSDPGRHTIAAGETLYHIATINGITVAQILEANPALDPANYQAGTVIVIPQPTAGAPAPHEVPDEPVATAPVTSANTYTVRIGDTFYGISRRYGISVGELMAVNPGVSVLSEGQTINLPQQCDAPLSDGHLIMSSILQQPGSSDTLYIAVPLEFTHRDAPDRRSTDFLRGLVLAADSLRSYGKPIGLLVYDISSPDTPVDSVLADPMFRKAKVIVGPFSTVAFKQFADYANRHSVYLLNNFLIKDESQRTNPYVMQSSLPHDLFYGNAADYFVKTYPDVTTVFLQSSTNNRKAEMVDIMQKRLLAAGRRYMVINFKDEITLSELTKLPKNTSYAFVTNTDSLPAIAKAVEQFVKNRPSDNVYVLGYHDWLRHNNPGYNNLENCNAFIFSRFFVEAVPTDETSLGAMYRKWYGGKPSDNLPHWFAYGFDTGMYLIRALNVNGGDFRGYTPSYVGEEYMFDFKPIGSDRGLTNDSEVIITVMPGNMRLRHQL